MSFGEERVNPFLAKPPAVRNRTGCVPDTMANESYSEIAMQQATMDFEASGGGGVPPNRRPDEPDFVEDDERGGVKEKRPDSLVRDKSAFPYNLDGVVSKDGNMTHFVAENLEFKIKLSSPVTKKDVGGLYLRHNSTPSTSGSRQQQQPQIDSNVLNDIEIEAQYLAASVDNLTENLCNLLHSISSIAADNVEIHKNAVNKLTDSMDANIKSMYTIMAKTEEISKSMKPTEQLSTRIREIKRLVDMLESNL